MIHRDRLVAGLTVCGLAGVLLATLAMAADTHGGMHGHGHAGHDPADAAMSGSATAPTFESEMAQANARMHAGMDITPSGDTDRDFARMMIPHHQGAIDMALVELKYGRDEKLRRLAQSIIVEQGQEIAYMRSLLAASRQDTSTADPSAAK
jgi:uncharacterized protein (DUF305 family)